MDPIDVYAVWQLKEFGCMKDLEVLCMLDPIDVHSVQQLKSLLARRALMSCS